MLAFFNSSTTKAQGSQLNPERAAGVSIILCNLNAGFYNSSLSTQILNSHPSHCRLYEQSLHSVAKLIFGAY